MTSHKTWLHNFEAFHLASYISIHLIIYEQKHLILKLMSETFDTSIWWLSFWLLGTIHFQFKSLSPLPSQILVCATTFAAHSLFEI